jgi:glycosyltransferase involved in cell wall biosynthesis
MDPHPSVPLISVIIPVYNVREHLAECLASICDQDYRNVEIVCVNDGSTDGSGDVLDAMARRDARIHVLTQDNKGVSAARNAGLEMASGAYVIFVDGDDRLLPAALRAIFDSLEERDFDIAVFSGVSEIPMNWIEEVLSVRDAVFENEGCRDVLLHERGCIPFLWNKVYRRAFLVENDIRFNNDFSLGEDCAFQFLAFPLAQLVVFSAQKIYGYRNCRLGSVMENVRGDVSRQQADNIEVFRYILGIWEERGWLAGYETELLTCIAFLFSDAVKLSPPEFFSLMYELRWTLEGHFTPEMFQYAETDVRWFYKTVFCVGSERTAQTCGARRGMLSYRLYRAASDIKNGRLHQ